MASIFQLPFSPYPIDGIHTETSQSQSETEQSIHRLLTTSPPPHILQKTLHTQFLARNLFNLPEPYVALDASRPWLIFWAVHSLDLMGVALDSGTKSRVANTILSFQHPTGGFGGGPGQLPHLLPTYASIMSLAIVGNISSTTNTTDIEEGTKAWDAIDRTGLYNFFMSCKNDDGSFVVCKGGEVDVRGIYCLLVVATLLDILTPELIEGTDKFIAGCQTYEGGFASSSFPNSISSPPMAEAHGGYTSCALFSHFLLRPFTTSTTSSSASSSSVGIDVGACLRWAAYQQSSAIEGGGFRGRTNKLVDGCYGWWVGGLFAVVESLVGRVVDEGVEGVEGEAAELEVEEKEEEWEEMNKDMLLNRVALQEYVLVAAQSEKGGLRDKPGKSPDLYHTCNNLSGLSSAQHLVHHSPSLIAKNKAAWKDTTSIISELPITKEDDEVVQGRRKNVWANALGWVEDESAFLAVGGEENRVNTTTPVFNILLLRFKPFINHFYGQE